MLFFKSGYRDLNSEPPAPKAGAIANYAIPRKINSKGKNQNYSKILT